MPTTTPPVEGLFPDCAFPADCECRKRGYEHEADSCRVPTVVAAIAAVGMAQWAPGLFGGTEPGITPDQRARARAASWALVHLSDLANADLYRNTEMATAYLDDFQPMVRMIGETLSDLGGRALMLTVHDAIEARYPRLGGNLAVAWNGIGDWEA